MLLLVNGVQYKRKLKDWNCTRRRKGKNSKALKCGSTLLAQRLVTEVPSYLRFLASTGKRLGQFWLTRLPAGRYISFPYFTSLSYMLLAWLDLFWILFLLSADENILRQFQLVLPTKFAAYRPNLLALDFSPKDPIGSSSNGGHLEISSINTRRTAIFIHSLAAVNYLLPRGETLFHLPSIKILEIFKDLSSRTRKYSRIFSLAKLS